jgi:hypothetical protein
LRTVAVFAGLLFATFGFLFVGTALADGDCDPAIKPAGPIPFGPRGDGPSSRCEGFFESPVKGRLFDVVAYTDGLERVPPQGTTEMSLEAAAPVQTDLTVVARSLSDTEFYQMTGTIAQGKRLVWPLKDVVLATSGPKARIGLLGSFKDSSGNEVFVPIVDKAQPSGAVHLTVRARVVVLKLKFRVRPDDDTGAFGDWRDLAKKAQPGDLIPIDFSSLPAGQNYLEISGTPTTSTIATTIGVHLVR